MNTQWYYLGIHFIYYLAKALKIGTENILIVGEMCDKYDDRQFTLCAISKSGNRDAVNIVMVIQFEYGSCFGTIMMSIIRRFYIT